ncbi:MAG: Crp/Fnr family transcriptional regulator [Ruminococcus sp.]|nr:Crp/Fnr family transcriptional regulator [Ruminococcus sp.]
MLPEDNILFKGISHEDCRRMISCFNCEVRSFRSGSCIADYSRTSDKIGIVLSGSASMVRYDVNGVRTIAETLGEQSIFGEFFTFAGSHRSSIEIVADTDCQILFVRREELMKRCEKACRCHSMVVENLLSLMSEKAISLSEHIEVLSQRSIEDKLIAFLQITEDNTPKGKAPQIPFSTTALSDYLCVNRSALQRQIAKLKKEGVLTISKRSFRLMRSSE